MNRYLIGILLVMSYVLVGCNVADVVTNVVMDTPTNVDKRGFEPVQVSLDNQVPLDNDELMNLYSASYALLIGESDYTNWSKLESVPSELQQFSI